MNRRFGVSAVLLGFALLTGCGANTVTTGATTAPVTPSVDASALLKSACQAFRLGDSDFSHAYDSKDQAGMRASLDGIRVAADEIGPIDGDLATDMRKYAEIAGRFAAGQLDPTDSDEMSKVGDRITIKCGFK